MFSEWQIDENQGGFFFFSLTFLLGYFFLTEIGCIFNFPFIFIFISEFVIILWQLSEGWQHWIFVWGTTIAPILMTLNLETDSIKWK